MRQNMNGRGELLSFLKGETHTGIDWTKNVDVSEVSRISGSKNLAIQQVTYELSGLSEPINNTVILEEDGRRYTFKNVFQTGQREAVAEDLEIEQL